VTTFTLGATLLALAAPAAGQTIVHAIRQNGDLLRVDRTSGAAAYQVSTGVPCRTAHSLPGPSGSYGYSNSYILIAGPDAAEGDRLTSVTRWTGTSEGTHLITGVPEGYQVRALAVSWNPSTIYAILSADDPTTEDLLATIDASANCNLLGPTGRADLEALATGPSSGQVYALGTANGGALYVLYPSSGPTAVLIGPGDFGDSTTLATLADGSLLACGSNLLSVDPSSGATTLIGPTGFSDIRGLAATRICYANCYLSDSPPVLNLLDFLCFLNRFAAGDPYANCDGSTTPPVLNILDFNCFLNNFASNCTAP
jgi:hypothetical protein